MKITQNRFEFYIGDYVWEVVCLPPHDTRLLKDGEHCWGLTDFDNYTIFLDKNMTSQKLNETLIHELTRVYLRSTTTSISTEKEFCDFVARWGDMIMHIKQSFFEECVDMEE